MKKTEQVLKFYTQDGKMSFIGHTCASMDKVVPKLFGVSRAIIENVLFCHQDDSLWLFDENKKLKGIFDEIFETDKISKVIESMEKLMKDYKKQSNEAEKVRIKCRTQFDYYVGSCKSFEKVLKKIKEKTDDIEKNEAKLTMM